MQCFYLHVRHKEEKKKMQFLFTFLISSRIIVHLSEIALSL